MWLWAELSCSWASVLHGAVGWFPATWVSPQGSSQPGCQLHSEKVEGGKMEARVFITWSPECHSFTCYILCLRGKPSPGPVPTQGEGLTVTKAWVPGSKGHWDPSKKLPTTVGNLGKGCSCVIRALYFLEPNFLCFCLQIACIQFLTPVVLTWNPWALGKAWETSWNYESKVIYT